MSDKTASVTENQQEAKTKPPKKKPRGRVTIIRDRCKGCGYCVEFCPTGFLEMSPEFNPKGYHFPRLVSGRDCTGCDLCGMYCPDFAICGTRLPADVDGDEPADQPNQE